MLIYNINETYLIVVDMIKFTKGYQLKPTKHFKISNSLPKARMKQTYQSVFLIGISLQRGAKNK